MPLPVLGALVVFGIGGVVLLVHLLRMSKRSRFDGDAAARDALLHDYPDARIDRVIVGDDGRAALLATDRGPAVAVGMGDRRFTRVLARGDLNRVREDQRRLRVALADFGAPSLTLTLSDPDRGAAAKAILEAAR